MTRERERKRERERERVWIPCALDERERKRERERERERVCGYLVHLCNEFAKTIRLGLIECLFLGIPAIKNRIMW